MNTSTIPSASESANDSYWLFLANFFGLSFVFRQFKVERGIIKEKRDEIKTLPQFGGMFSVGRPFRVREFSFVVSTDAGEVAIWVPRSLYEAMRVGDPFPIKYRISRFDRRHIQGVMIQPPNGFLGTNQD